MNSRILVVGLIAAVAMPLLARAVEVGELNTEAKAAYGATHFVKFDYTDLTESASNTVQVFTNVFPIAAKMGVEVVAMILDRAFDSGNTNHTGSTLFQIGDSTSSNRFLDTTELNVDGTEVFLKYGRTIDSTVSITVTNAGQPVYTTQVITNGASSWTVLSNVTFTVTTNTLAVTVATGSKVYTAADYLRFRFQPNAEEALGALSNGQVRVLIRARDALNPTFP